MEKVNYGIFPRIDGPKVLAMDQAQKSNPIEVGKRKKAMTLEERIQKLELELRHTKRQRRLTWGFAAAAIMLVVAMLCPRGNIAAQGNAAPEIRTRQIVLVDENGKPRCIIAMGKEGPGLAMNDENGEIRSLFKIDTDRARLSLYDEKGEPRAVLDADKNGSGLALYDENGNPLAGLFVGKDGPKMTLFDNKGKEQWSTPATK